jgi:hypothetical protein
MKKQLVILLLVWAGISILNGAIAQDRAGVLVTLKRLHDGYDKRDVSQIDAWVDDIFTDEVRVIGTNCLYPGHSEWFTGKEKARKVFARDWKYWGHLKIYYQQAQVSVSNDHAWVAMTGIVSRTGKEAPSYARSIKRIKEITENKSMPDKLKLKSVIYDAALLLHQFEQGSQLNWPLRITASLVRKNDKWLITQTHFSYAHRGFPTIRLTPSQVKDFENHVKKSINKD